MSETIEVGDVFTFEDGLTEYTCTHASELLLAAGRSGFTPGRCKLVRKAAKDPYAGLTLPTPPAGYRLAKWGEEHEAAMYWNVTRWTFWGNLCSAAFSLPDTSIYAIPIDPPASTAPKSWQFPYSPWVQPQPKTLADCVEDTPVVVRNMRGEWIVVYRIGTQAFNQGTAEYLAEAGNLKLIRYLDPPQPAQLRLEDVPDGRCIQNPEDPEMDRPLYWRHAGNWFCRHRAGTIKIVGGNGTALSAFAVTDYIAEFREASC